MFRTALAACVLLTGTVFAEPGKWNLKVSDNGRHLVREDGRYFFWLADTAWELFHRLDRAEAEQYLENRRQKGFNVIYAVALAELDGLRTPNPYGHRPLLQTDDRWDPTRPDVKEGPDNDYWDHVEWIIDRAAEKQMHIAVLPSWGDKVELKWGVGPVIFNPENARQYGRWIGQRYQHKPNIIWMIGGDRPSSDTNVWSAMAEAIRSVAPAHLMTYHFRSRWAHASKWLDLHTIASGHERHDEPKIYSEISAYWALIPPKPVLDGEPRYENHPVNWHNNGATGWFNDFDIRQAAYWSTFAGACGFSYGSHDVWQMHKPGFKPVGKARNYWYETLDLPGAAQMRHLRKLVESRPPLDRVPDQSIIAQEPGSGGAHIRACRGKDYALVYLPYGQNVTIQMGIISGDQVIVHWFNPREGAAQRVGVFKNSGVMNFDPPGEPGRGNDWVLVLDDAQAGFE
jgi:hypothetical protein